MERHILPPTIRQHKRILTPCIVLPLFSQDTTPIKVIRTAIRGTPIHLITPVLFMDQETPILVDTTRMW